MEKLAIVVPCYNEEEVLNETSNDSIYNIDIVKSSRNKISFVNRSQKEKKNFLIKYINGKYDVSSALGREKVGTMSGICGILCNALLCIMKFVIGTSLHGNVFFDTDKSYTEYTNR